MFSACDSRVNPRDAVSMLALYCCMLLLLLLELCYQFQSNDSGFALLLHATAGTW
jgi:hypothetical protein